jgi:hypothetical protein
MPLEEIGLGIFFGLHTHKESLVSFYRPTHGLPPLGPRIFFGIPPMHQRSPLGRRPEYTLRPTVPPVADFGEELKLPPGSMRHGW